MAVPEQLADQPVVLIDGTQDTRCNDEDACLAYSLLRFTLYRTSAPRGRMLACGMSLAHQNGVKPFTPVGPFDLALTWPCPKAAICPVLAAAALIGAAMWQDIVSEACCTAK